MQFTPRRSWPSLLALLCLHAFVLYPADAADLASAIRDGQSLSSIRIRYEQAEQDNKARTADATTLRSLLGWQTERWHDLSLTAQLINVSKLGGDFYDKYKDRAATGSQLDYPTVADPDYTGINQLHLSWRAPGETTVRFGRQSVKLDNTRFIGNVEFRQVMQVFDGIAVESAALPDTTIYLAHFDRVTQVTTSERRGHLDIGHLRYQFAPAQSLAAYLYRTDFRDLGTGAASGLGAADPSNRISGVRLDGKRAVTGTWSLLYTAEYAKQVSDAGGSALIDAEYQRLGLGVAASGWSVRMDQELRSSNGGRYAFQTPFGTNHLFQGWAEQFLVTPREGVRDRFITFSARPLPALALAAEYHRLSSDVPFQTADLGYGSHYGNEWDLAATWTLSPRRWMRVELADFREADVLRTGRKADTRRVWLTMMFQF